MCALVSETMVHEVEMWFQFYQAFYKAFYNMSNNWCKLNFQKIMLIVGNLFDKQSFILWQILFSFVNNVLIKSVVIHYIVWGGEVYFITAESIGCKFVCMRWWWCCYVLMGLSFLDMYITNVMNKNETYMCCHVKHLGVFSSSVWQLLSSVKQSNPKR